LTVFVLTVDGFGALSRGVLGELSDLEGITLFSDYFTLRKVSEELERFPGEVHCPVIADAPPAFVPEEDLVEHVRATSGCLGDAFRAPYLAMDRGLLRSLSDLVEVDSSGFFPKGGALEVEGVVEVPITCDVHDGECVSKVVERADRYDLVVLRAGNELPLSRAVRVFEVIAGSFEVLPLSEAVREVEVGSEGLFRRCRFGEDGVLTEVERLVLRVASEVWELHARLVREVGDRELLLSHLCSESLRALDRLLQVCSRLREELGREYEEALEERLRSAAVIGAVRRLSRRLRLREEEAEDRGEVAAGVSSRRELAERALEEFSGGDVFKGLSLLIDVIRV